VALPAFAHRTLLLLSAGCAAIDWAYSSKPAAAACGDAEWGGLTDGRPAVT